MIHSLSMNNINLRSYKVQVTGNSVYRKDLFYSFGSINDGILEVAGLYSALHIARLQVNMADPLRLGQARSIKVSTGDQRFSVHQSSFVC